jgi:hypothetical protein
VAIGREVEGAGGSDVREFRDHHGRQWRAWEVRPEEIHPLTKAEDYLAECYRDGWIVFETMDGVDKRRLCPLPYGWQQRSDADLEHLLERADRLRPVGGKRGRTLRPADLPPNVPPDIAPATPRTAEGSLDLRYLGVVRSFLYPGGQVWRAHVAVQGDSAAPPVLRFASDTHSIDLTEWPPEWVDLSDDELVALLRIGESIQERRQDDPPTRRHDDPRSPA